MKDKLSCADGTVVLVSLVNDRFKMMTVKDKFCVRQASVMNAVFRGQRIVLLSNKVQCRHQLVKLDVTPTSMALTDHQCQNCSRDIDDVLLEQMPDLDIEDNQLLLESTGTLRDKSFILSGI